MSELEDSRKLELERLSLKASRSVLQSKRELLERRRKKLENDESKLRDLEIKFEIEFRIHCENYQKFNETSRPLTPPEVARMRRGPKPYECLYCKRTILSWGEEARHYCWRCLDY